MSSLKLRLLPPKSAPGVTTWNLPPTDETFDARYGRW